ncbi:MAG: PTS sugar transporter subunit IIA [Spirochaetaceae bacterium]|jgi:PTS system nitrogen regulatory IIA component|nr:PTS sugar transporter subunit IIA [Spirochaetaceae bacterium]
MDLESVLRSELCLTIKSKTKTEVLLELIDEASKVIKITNTDQVKSEIFYREQIMSTGIGQGIAVPHVRFEGIKDPIVIIGKSEQGIKDYESLDQQPVHIVVLIIVGADQHKEYLRILSLIIHSLKDNTIRENILSAQSGEEIINIFLGEK